MKIKQDSKSVKTNAKKSLGLVAAVTAGVVTMSSGAFAAMDLTGVAYNTDDALAVGTLVLGAVAIIWGVRKAISMGSKG